jgi:phage host-nuclease inhibitor protein Gam
MKNRITKPLGLVIESRLEAETHVNLVTSLVNERRGVASEMDEQILNLKKEYELQLANLDVQIKVGTDNLEAWALANPEEFGKAKSIEFLAGRIGFRTGTPKLTLLSRAWSWDKVLAAIQKFGFQFVRTKEEVDKEAILAFAAAEADKARLDSKVLAPIGVKITQGESFFVEPKLTEPVPA